MSRPKGYKHTEETKKKISKIFKGKKLSEEHKRKMSLAKLGKKNPFYGRKHTEELKKKISLIKSGKNNPFYGKKHTEETKKKMSEACKGKKHQRWKGGSYNYWSKIARRIWGNFWGQQIFPGYVIHHKDGDITNNNISNLALLTRSYHRKIHNKKKLKE